MASRCFFGVLLCIGVAAYQVNGKEMIENIACATVALPFCCTNLMAVKCKGHCAGYIEEKCPKRLSSETTTPSSRQLTTEKKQAPTTTKQSVTQPTPTRPRDTAAPVTSRATDRTKPARAETTVRAEPAWKTQTTRRPGGETFAFETTHSYRITFPSETGSGSDEEEDGEYKEEGWKEYEELQGEQMAGTPPAGRESLILGVFEAGERIPVNCGKPPIFIPCVKLKYANLEFAECCQSHRFDFACRRICSYRTPMFKTKKVAFRDELCPRRQFREVMSCAASNGPNFDNRVCCRTKGVPEKCMPFCRPSPAESVADLEAYVKNNDLFSDECFTAMPFIMQCHHAKMLHPEHIRIRGDRDNKH